MARNITIEKAHQTSRTIQLRPSIVFPQLTTALAEIYIAVRKLNKITDQTTLANLLEIDQPQFHAYVKKVREKQKKEKKHGK